MTLLAPTGLWALLAIPVVLALHLLRRHVTERRVAALFLFDPGRVASPEGPRRTRLLRTPSLWLELAAALLFALWLAQPAFGVTDPQGVVIVLDDSASMAAAGMRARIEKACDAWPATAVFLATGMQPRRLASIDDWQPGQPAHDVVPALALAAEWAGPAGRVVFLTDRIPQHVPPRCEVNAFGQPASNAALTDARRSEGHVFVSVRAWASAPVRTTLTVGRESRTLTLAPGRVVRVRLPDPAPDRSLSLRLSDDALKLDNEWTLLPDPTRSVGVAHTLSKADAEALRIDAALHAVENIAVRPLPQARLVVGRAPARPVPGRWELRLATGDGPRDFFVAPFLLARPESLLDGVTLQGVAWAAGRTNPPGEPLVQAGQRVLLSRQGRRLHLNLDPAQSTLAASSDWPIFLANVVDHVRADLPGTVARNVLVGGTLRYRRDIRAPVHVIGPDGRRREGYGGAEVSWSAIAPGRWRVVRGDKDLAEFSVLFLDPRESDLTRAASGERDAATAPRPSAHASAAGERFWLALVLLACVCADWWWLGRSARTRTRRRAPGPA